MWHSSFFFCSASIEVKDEAKIFVSNNKVLFVFKVTGGW